MFTLSDVRNSSIMTNVGSLLTTGLFLMFLARFAYRNAFKDSL